MSDSAGTFRPYRRRLRSHPSDRPVGGGGEDAVPGGLGAGMPPTATGCRTRRHSHTTTRICLAALAVGARGANGAADRVAPAPDHEYE
jgi:hypothetical protein